MTEEIANTLSKISRAYVVDRNRVVTKWEGEFAIDLYKKWERFGDKTFLSEKQIAVINKIAAKLN